MRLLNRLLAFLLALALAGGSVFVIIEVVAQAAGAKPVLVPWLSWVHWARTTIWNAGTVSTWAGVLIAIGAVLLLIELAPRRVTRLRMRPAGDGTAHTDVAVTRHGVARSVHSAVLDVDGVSKASVRVRRRRVVVRADAIATYKESAQQLVEPVSAAAGERLDALALERPLRVAARVTAAKP